MAGLFKKSQKTKKILYARKVLHTEGGRKESPRGEGGGSWKRRHASHRSTIAAESDERQLDSFSLLGRSKVSRVSSLQGTRAR